MCGRYTLAGKPVDLEKSLRANLKSDAIGNSFNIAPSQKVAAILDTQASEIVPAIWGLKPVWFKPEMKIPPMINVRADSLHDKPGFRKFNQKHHCLIPATGFYEWKAEGKRKQPYYIHLLNEPVFCFAGIYEWLPAEKPDESPMASVAIITTEANSLMAGLHHRMPVIVPQAEWHHWLNPQQHTPEQLCIPYPSEEMEAWPVSTLVNSPTNNHEKLTERITPAEGDAQLDMFA